MFGALPDVVIPKMYSELTSRRVLVMEWVEVCPFFTGYKLELLSSIDFDFCYF